MKTRQQRSGGASAATEMEHAPELDCVFEKKQRSTLQVRFVLRKLGDPSTMKTIWSSILSKCERHIRLRQSKRLSLAIFQWRSKNVFLEIVKVESSSCTARARAGCRGEVCRTSRHPQHSAVLPKKKVKVSVSVSSCGQP